MLPTPLHPLALTFLAPGFFWAGAGLISIPILIHILNRRRFKTVPWAAMEYLLQALRKNRRRVRFEQWLLLAVRCLVLLLIGLALARPLACDRSLASLAAQRNALHVFVIDNSYSMAYEADRPNAKTHLDQAKLLAKDRIDRLVAGGDSVAVITAASPAAAVLAKPTYDLAAAKSAIDRIEQAYTATDLSGALQKALELGRSESTHPQKSLYLFTDATRAAWLAPGQSRAIASAGPELAKLYRLHHINLGKPNQWNQALLDLNPTGNLVTTKFATDFVALAKGFGPGPDAQLQWKLDGQVLPGGGAGGTEGAIHLDLDSPPQTQSQARFTTGGPHVLTASLVTTDRLKPDDTRYRVVEVASELKVLIVEGDHSTPSFPARPASSAWPSPRPRTKAPPALPTPTATSPPKSSATSNYPAKSSPTTAPSSSPTSPSFPPPKPTSFANSSSRAVRSCCSWASRFAAKTTTRSFCPAA